MSIVTLAPGSYGPQSVSDGETLLALGGPSVTTITDTGGFYTFGINVSQTGVQIGDLSGHGFTIQATAANGVAVQILGSNNILEGNTLSENSPGLAAGDLVTGSGANNLTIEANTFGGTGNFLAYVNGANDTYTPSTNVNFINNNFTGTATADISDDAASGIISGNTFTGSGQEAIFLGTVSAASANYFNAAYGTTYVSVPGTITVTGNHFSAWTGADVSTWDANYTFAKGGAGVTLTDTVTASGQEIDTVTGWTGGTISLDAGFDTALGVMQNGKNEVDVFLSNGDEIIVQGNNVKADSIGDMVGASTFKDVVQFPSGTSGTVDNGSYLVLVGSHDVVKIGNGSDVVTAGSNDIITIGNGHDTVNAGDGNTITLGDGNDTVTAGANNTIIAGDGNDTVSAGDGSIIILGDGNDTVTAGAHSTIIAGDGKDTVSAGDGSTIILGDGKDTVIAGTNNNITLGNGNDTVYAAKGDTITVGHGHDTFGFGLSPGQTTPGMIGPVTINNFDPGKDVIKINHALAAWDASYATLTAAVSHIQTVGGNAVITLDSSGDTITLTGVSASSLHASDFAFA